MKKESPEKLYNYRLTIRGADTRLATISKMMEEADFGISCLLADYQFEFQTTNKWDKKRIDKFIKILEVEGWYVKEHYLYQQPIFIK